MLHRVSGLYKQRPTLREIATADPQLFSEMVLPESIALEDFAAMALMEYGDLDTIFRDTGSARSYLKTWSKYKLPGWERIEAALAAEYNPINNYDMTEEETPAETTETITPAETTETETPAETTETRTPAETTQTETPAETTETRTPAEITETETPAETTETRTPAETTTTTSPAETTVTDRPPEVTDTGSSSTGIFGFNSSSATPANTGDSSTARTVQTAGTAVTTVQTPGSGAITVDNPETVKRETDTAGSVVTSVQTPETVKRETDTAGSVVTSVQSPETREFTVQHKRTLTRSGNIGVTTSAQMVTGEVELRQRFQLMDVLLSDFRTDICVGVW